jgi:hypothetical protein
MNAFIEKRSAKFMNCYSDLALDEGTLATRLLVAYAGPPDKHRWSSKTRLHSNSDADVDARFGCRTVALPFLPAYWKHGALHDVVEPMVDHVS